jgi:hypothetical protein
MKSRRAFLVPALLVVSVFMVLCIGLLTRQPMRNLAAVQSLYQVQARQIALAGIEQARQRLASDFNTTVSNTSFSDSVTSVGGSTALGSYLVTLDGTWSITPFYVVNVESEGFYGDPVRPLSRYVLRATLDVREEGSPGVPNPGYLRLLRWQESVP